VRGTKNERSSGRNERRRRGWYARRRKVEPLSPWPNPFGNAVAASAHVRRGGRPAGMSCFTRRVTPTTAIPGSDSHAVTFGNTRWCVVGGRMWQERNCMSGSMLNCR